MTEPAIDTWLVRVRGRVQGVGFRDSCAEAAESLGVTGWVRNRSDGSVEALLQGPPAALERMRDWLQHGPPNAVVRELTVSPAPQPAAPLRRFERRRTE